MEAKHKIPSDADSIPIGDLRINDIPGSQPRQFGQVLRFVQSKSLEIGQSASSFWTGDASSKHIKQQTLKKTTSTPTTAILGLQKSAQANPPMDHKIWSKLPQVAMELIFARLPLHCIVQIRTLSKHWYSKIVSPGFQQALNESKAQSRNIAVVTDTRPKKVWAYDGMQSKWYGLPSQYDGQPVAADKGLLCFAKFDVHPEFDGTPYVQLVVSNPLTQASHDLPPLLGMEANPHRTVFLMVVDAELSQYSIFCEALNLDSKEPTHFWVYNSVSNTWVRRLPHTNKWERCQPSSNIWERCLRPQDITADGRYISVDFMAGLIHTWDLHSGVLISSNLPETLYNFHSSSAAQGPGFYAEGANNGRLLVVLDLVAGKLMEFQAHSEVLKDICRHPRLDEIQDYGWHVFACDKKILLLGVRRESAVEETDELSRCGVDLQEMLLMLVYDMSTKTWCNIAHRAGDAPLCKSSFVFELKFDAIP